MKACSDILDRFIAVDASADTPLHTQLRRSLRTIIEKHFEDGDRFFSEAELISHLRISQGTVRRALADLASEGLIERRVAKGSFVRKTKAGSQARSVGVFVPAFESAFWSRLLDELSRACRQMGCGMSVYHTERGDKVADAFRCLRNPPSEERVILLSEEESSAELLAALGNRNYRAVAVDIPLGKQCSFVGVDNAKGVLLGMEHLWELGHRRIAMLVHEEATAVNVVARVEPYRSWMRQHACEPIVIDCGCRRWDRTYEAAYQNMERIFAMSPRPTAVFTVTDAGAWAALRWCSDHDVSVPTELSVIGFDDDRPSQFTQPALTSIAQPMAEIAEAAMRILWSDSAEIVHERMAPSLVVRESTAPPTQSPAGAEMESAGLVTT